MVLSAMSRLSQQIMRGTQQEPLSCSKQRGAVGGGPAETRQRQGCRAQSFGPPSTAETARELSNSSTTYLLNTGSRRKKFISRENPLPRIDSSPNRNVAGSTNSSPIGSPTGVGSHLPALSQGRNSASSSFVDAQYPSNVSIPPYAPSTDRVHLNFGQPQLEQQLQQQQVSHSLVHSNTSVPQSPLSLKSSVLETTYHTSTAPPPPSYTPGSATSTMPNPYTSPRRRKTSGYIPPLRPWIEPPHNRTMSSHHSEENSCTSPFVPRTQSATPPTPQQNLSLSRYTNINGVVLPLDTAFRFQTSGSSSELSPDEDNHDAVEEDGESSIGHISPIGISKKVRRSSLGSNRLPIHRFSKLDVNSVGDAMFSPSGDSEASQDDCLVVHLSGSPRIESKVTFVSSFPDVHNSFIDENLEQLPISILSDGAFSTTRRHPSDSWMTSPKKSSRSETDALSPPKKPLSTPKSKHKKRHQ